MDEISRPVVFRSVARAELDAAADWYERCRAGLGPQFLVAVDRVLTRIARQPDFYPVEEQGVREARVPGFPYGIYSITEKNQRRCWCLSSFMPVEILLPGKHAWIDIHW